MATINKYQTKDNKPRYRVMWRDGETQKSKSFDRWAAANEFKVSIEHQLREGSYVAPSSLSVSELLDMWYAVVSANIAHNTKIGYSNNIRHIKEHIGKRPIQKLNAAEIESMYARLFKTFSSTSILYLHRNLNCAFKYARKKKLTNYNPCDDVTPPRKSKPELAVLRPVDVSKYIDAYKATPLYPAVCIALMCGLRKGEILALQWKDIDFENNVITVKHSMGRIDNKPVLNPPKSKKTRMVSMPEGLTDILKAHKEYQGEMKAVADEIYFVSDFVIVQQYGKLYHPRRFDWLFEKGMEKAGLPHVRFHDLRHTAASLMNLEGVQLKTISEILGHSSIAITADIYTNVFEESKKAAAASLNKYLDTTKMQHAESKPPQQIKPLSMKNARK
jgi:integrase